MGAQGAHDPTSFILGDSAPTHCAIDLGLILKIPSHTTQLL